MEVYGARNVKIVYRIKFFSIVGIKTIKIY